MFNAEIIAIGSELLTPHRSDTNSLWLTERLNSVGIEVKLKTIVGDDEARLHEAFSDALRRSEVIISTGGLGPTEDDITRKVVAQVTGRQLILDYGVLEQIRRRFTSRGYQMTPNNERQAHIPQGATVLPNPNGTAPGILIRHESKLLALLPGPPREMCPMFDDFVMPDLEKMACGVRIARRVLKVSGLGESALDNIISPVYRAYDNPTTTILFTNAEVEIHLIAKAESLVAAEALLDELANRIAEKLGDNLYSTRDESLEQIVGHRLIQRQYTIATAESCTGGLIAERMTSVPGASQYFVGCLVTYTEEAKTKMLGIPSALIQSRGVVSAEVAESMAKAARELTGSTIAVSVTGIAGPGGGTEATPVGTVYIGVADRTTSLNRRLVFPGDRHLIRWRASQAALDMVRRCYLL